jgi:large subunit ribosomal protein L25
MSKKNASSKLTLEPRSATGTTAAHALRRAGKIPGVVYGHGSATPVTVDIKLLAELLHSGNRSHIVDATIDGKRDSVLLRKIEADPITRKPLSVDFQRVRRDEAVNATIAIVTTGNAIGVRDQGGVLDVVLHALDIKGPADSIPDNITIDITEFELHKHVTAGEIQLPPGFTLITNADQVVLSLEATRANVADTVETETAETPAAIPEG